MSSIGIEIHKFIYNSNIEQLVLEGDDFLWSFFRWLNSTTLAHDSECLNVLISIFTDDRIQS